MSDPIRGTNLNPHPISGHRTPDEIAADEAGPIGQPDPDIVSARAASARKSPQPGAVSEPPETSESSASGEDRGSE